MLYCASCDTQLKTEPTIQSTHILIYPVNGFIKGFMDKPQPPFRYASVFSYYFYAIYFHTIYLSNNVIFHTRDRSREAFVKLSFFIFDFLF